MPWPSPTTGDTVLLFGPSGAGKTTVARTLGRDLGYLSDETAGVRDDLSVVPYPKPLSILSPGQPDQGAGAGRPARAAPGRPGPVPGAGVVQLRRQPSGGGVEVERLATVDGITELVAQSSYSRLLERPLHRLAALAHDVGGIARVTYTEAGDLRPTVDALLAWSAVSRARRLPIVDEYVEDGRVAVYAGNGEVVALSELATWAWAALTDDWTPVADLAAGAGRRVRRAPTASTRSRPPSATLRTLAEHGLVELDAG